VTDLASTARPLPAQKREVPTARSVPRALGLVGYVAMTVVAGAWAAVLGAVAIWRHQEFLSHRGDLGVMVQTIWSTAHGRFLEVTDAATGEQAARLAGHVDPILVLYVPLWWLHSSPETLLVAHAAAFAAGVYPVVRLALEHTRSRPVAGLLGAWFLCFPWIVWMTFNELNPSGLSLPLLLYAFWFLDQRRLGRFWVAIALTLATGELIGLTIAALGVWHALRTRELRLGATIAAVGAGWTTLCLALIVPSFYDGQSSRFYGHFENVGGSPVGLVRTLFTDPGTIVEQVATAGDLQYVAWLAAPTLLLFLGAPLLLIVALPQLAVNLLAEQPATVSPLYHYSAPIVATLIVASVLTIGRLSPRRRILAAAGVLFSAAFLLGSIPPVPGQERYLFPSREGPARIAAMEEAVALVPLGVPVTSTNRLGAHLSERRVVHVFPRERDAEWAAVDAQDPPSRWWDPSDRHVFRRYVERIHANPDWELVFERESIRVYRRQASAPRGSN